MIEANAPIDIGKDKIAAYKEDVEKLLVKFPFQQLQQSLPDLILEMDPEERYVMSNTERDTYISIREGMQVFRAVTDMVGNTAGLQNRLMSVPQSQLGTDSELSRIRSFTHNYATYVAANYIKKKLDVILKSEEHPSEDKPDMSFARLDSNKPKEAAMITILAPIYGILSKHKLDKKTFIGHADFPSYVKDYCDKIIELTTQEKGKQPDLEMKSLNGYQFRIMDDFLQLQGFENKSVASIEVKQQKLSFQPITSKDITGNQSAKRQVSRNIERVCCYDTKEQKNPFLELGGVDWTTLGDGLPGTGKSSMWRLAMTILQERAEAMGLKYNIFSVDQSIKDEFYGKSGKILLERIAPAKDPSSVSIGIFDDIDMLTGGSRKNAQGADNDINNIIMQYLDGIWTVRRGNVTNYAASNEPANLDGAVRNRMNNRLLIDGPITQEDFADMFMLRMGKFLKLGLLPIKEGAGYVPFATQDIPRDDGKYDAKDVAAYMADDFASQKNATVIDFGKYMSDLKKKDQRITGRSANAIMEAVKGRSANFDVPREWFGSAAAYRDKPYAEKVKMCAALYQKITPNVLFEEAQKYFDSEQRFKDTEAEDHINGGYNSRVWDMQAELRFNEEQVKLGNKSVMAKTKVLRTLLGALEDKRLETVRLALEHADEEDAKLLKK